MADQSENVDMMTRVKIALGLSQVGTTERKTVTFGDASAVVGSRFWSIVSVTILMLLWFLSGAFELTDTTFLPTPASTWEKFVEVATEGYRNVTLWENVLASLLRVVYGFGLGCLFGIPIGLAMGLSNTLRGVFDPIVEFFRPIPPLAFIPLFILWFGIGEQSKSYCSSSPPSGLWSSPPALAY